MKCFIDCRVLLVPLVPSVPQVLLVFLWVVFLTLFSGQNSLSEDIYMLQSIYSFRGVFLNTCLWMILQKKNAVHDPKFWLAQISGILFCRDSGVNAFLHLFNWFPCCLCLQGTQGQKGSKGSSVSAEPLHYTWSLRWFICCFRYKLSKFSVSPGSSWPERRAWPDWTTWSSCKKKFILHENKWGCIENCAENQIDMLMSPMGLKPTQKNCQWFIFDCLSLGPSWWHHSAPSHLDK